MEDFEIKFAMRNGLIRAMKIMNEAFDNVASKNSGLNPMEILKYKGAYELVQEFNKLLYEQYKELGG